MEALFFWLFAIGLVLCGVAVVVVRNPVGAALCLAATFLFQACLYVTLQAFFLAAVQVIVYAGAVMVLFLFIIMLLDLKAESAARLPLGRIVIAGLLLAGMAYFYGRIMASFSGIAPLAEWNDLRWTESAKQVGNLLFTRYSVPFLATAVLLLVATVGVVILSRKETK